MQDFPTPPVIGISGSRADSASVMAMMTQIRSTGAIPLFLGNHAARIAREGGNVHHAVSADLTKIDALVVMGNNGDIDPTLYGEANTGKSNIEKDEARMLYEFEALEQAIRQKMPVLGVCGGMQRINVLLGGSLHQHIPDLLGGDNTHNQQNAGIPSFCPVQAVKLCEGTRLRQIATGIRTVYTPAHEALPEGILLENSMHHQAVNRLAKPLTPAAISADGILEAFEARPGQGLEGQYVVGVQWHPEFGASAFGGKLAGTVAQVAQSYAQSLGRVHPLHEAAEETLFSGAPCLHYNGKLLAFQPANKQELIMSHAAKILAESAPGGLVRRAG